MISGNLWTMGLHEILQWVSTGRKTGTLEIEKDPVVKRILFRDGSICSSWSNDPRESLGQFLIRTRRVTEEQLFKALTRAGDQGRMLGAILIEDGLLGEDELRSSLQAKAEESIYDLFLWADGRFEFKDGELPGELTVQIDMPVTAVILEGIRRVDEWKRIQTVFPSRQTSFKLKGAGVDGLSADERQAVGLAAAGKTLAAIALELRRSDFDAAALFFDLYQRGLVVVDKVQPDPEEHVLSRIKDLLDSARGHLDERRYDAALKDYEAVLKLDRLNQTAKNGLVVVFESRSRERALRLVPRDKVPHLAVDFVTLTRQSFDPHEGFVLSRVNGQWDVQSILKLCPMAEEETLLIFARLLEKEVIELRDP